MKTQYVVMNLNFQVRGILSNKDQLKRFKEQRDIEHYMIEELKSKQWIDMLHTEAMCVVDKYGMILFRDEYEYMLDNFALYLSDLEWLTTSLFNIEQDLKLDDDERKIITEFVKTLVGHLREYNAQLYEDNQTKDFPETESKFFKMKKVCEPSIGVYEY